ncbi:hypothetical protein CIRMBP1248_02600 [Enterococcus cecorum]|nr:hypothetical protein CIRMBP1248_02600 [Enterococcus cecorum]
MKEVLEEIQHLGGWNEKHFQLVYNKLNGEYYIWGPPSKDLIDKIVKVFRETCDPEFEFEGTTEELYPAIHSWIEQHNKKINRFTR